MHTSSCYRNNHAVPHLYLLAAAAFGMQAQHQAQYQHQPSSNVSTYTHSLQARSPSTGSLPIADDLDALGEPGSCVMLTVPGARRSVAFKEASRPYPDSSRANKTCASSLQGVCSDGRSDTVTQALMQPQEDKAAAGKNSR